MSEMAAYVYAFAVVAPAFVQIALAAGAPWGDLTMGGRWPGRLPTPIRFAAFLQACVLVGMAGVVLTQTPLVAFDPPRWLLWVVVAITALSTIGNWATPSQPERRAWGPLTALMLICVLIVVLT